VVEQGGGQIISLDAIVPGHGYGRALLTEIEGRIARTGGRRARLFTTNDNVGAIRTYLLAGYRLERVFLDSMDGVRALKPGVPLIGENGIPLRDMWEFVKNLEPR
jgi:GNAT superfamily N-acetyltransferase